MYIHYTSVGASVFKMAEIIYSYIYIYIYINLFIVPSEASCLSCSNSHQATSTAIQAKSQQQKHTCKTQSKAIHIHFFTRPTTLNDCVGACEPACCCERKAEHLYLYMEGGHMHYPTLPEWCCEPFCCITNARLNI